ncbi:hypothetical protein U1Q18_043491, partial [Sarracenia purpurea var. burkii]
MDKQSVPMEGVPCLAHPMLDDLPLPNFTSVDKDGEEVSHGEVLEVEQTVEGDADIVDKSGEVEFSDLSPQVCSAKVISPVMDPDNCCLLLVFTASVDGENSNFLVGKRHKQTVNLNGPVKNDLKLLDKMSQPNSNEISKDLDTIQVECGGSKLNYPLGGKSSKGPNHAKSGFEDHSRGSDAGQRGISWADVAE